MKDLCRSFSSAVFPLMLAVAAHSVAMTECSDGVDNDSDGFIDLDDFNCVDSEDNTERPTQCSDGIDNDSDGFIDLNDLNCVDTEDDTERPTQCSDGIDNDSDGFIDLNDLNCVNSEDDTEFNEPVFSDGFEDLN